jgi:RNA polymerase-binding transcription factor DksA
LSRSREEVLPAGPRAVMVKTVLDLAAMRQILETERDLLLERIAELNQGLAQPAGDSTEMLDLADVETEQDLQAKVLAKSQHQLDQVEAALERLKMNYFGR